MRVLVFFIAFLFITSCSSKFNKSEELQEFESIIGHKNALLIDSLLINFEKSLFNYYDEKSLNKVYKKFISDIKNSSIKDWKSIVNNQDFESFKKSSLYNDIYAITDSVWIEKDTSKLVFHRAGNPIGKRFKYLDTNENLKYYYTYSTLDASNKPLDSLILNEYKIIEYNTLGKYHKSLYSLQNKNKLIFLFYDLNDAFGIQPSNMKARGLLNPNINLNFENDLNRRIIMLELAY